jgi:uncharacterized protein DUF3987
VSSAGLETSVLSAREEVLRARKALFNGSLKLEYFRRRGIPDAIIKDAYIGYSRGDYLYPSIAREGGLLAVHRKSETRDANSKRSQRWDGYADNLPPRGHGKKPLDPAKIVLFGLETLKDLDPGSLVILSCGEEDALSLRSVSYTALSQPGAGLLEPVYAQMLADFDVVVFYDAGEEEEAYKDALKLKHTGARRVRVVEWPTEAPHGYDVNAKLVEDPNGFEGWVSQMISKAKPITSSPRDHGLNEARVGKPDGYKDSSGGRDDEGVWEDPAQLPEGLPAVAAFDTTMLPDSLRTKIEDTSERMQIPPDFLAAGAMVVSSSLVGRKFGIHPKQWDDWLVVANLWGLVVARPALLKSPALAEFMKLLDRLAAEARDRFEAELASYEVEVAVAGAEQGALKDALKRAAKEAETSGDRGELEQVAQRLRASQEVAPEMPVLRRYKTEDPTVEKIGEIVIENPQGILVHRDEASGLLGNLKKQGREGDRNSDDAVGLRLLGVPRRAAEPLSRELSGGTHGNELSALRAALTRSDASTWVKAMGASGDDYYQVWKILEGNPQ